MTAIWPGLLLIAYLAATGLILIARANVVGSGVLLIHATLLALMVAALRWRGMPGWMRDWLPALAVPVMYLELPTVIAAVGHHSVFDAQVLTWEAAIFGGQPSHDWAARWPSVWLSEPLHAAYVSYYAIALSVPALLYARGRRAEFYEGVFALLVTFVACFVCFIAFPVEGPRYAQTSMAPDGPIRRFTLSVIEGGASRGTAFPSSHVAVTVAQCVLAIRYFGRRGALLVPVAIGLALGAVYGGFHYATDAVAGALFGVAVVVVSLRASRRSAAQANATAPT